MPMNSPATSGPTPRAMLNWVELRVTALSIIERGTSSVMNACQDAMLRPVIRPETHEIATTDHGSSRPLTQSSHMASEAIIAADCVTIRTRRRWNRSAM